MNTALFSSVLLSIYKEWRPVAERSHWPVVISVIKDSILSNAQSQVFPNLTMIVIAQSPQWGKLCCEVMVSQPLPDSRPPTSVAEVGTGGENHLSGIHWEFLVLCRQLVFTAAPSEVVLLWHPSGESQVTGWGAGEGCGRCGSKLWPQHGSLLCSLGGDGFLRGFWVVFPWLWSQAATWCPCHQLPGCPTPKDGMLAKQHHSSLELSTEMKQINRNN